MVVSPETSLIYRAPGRSPHLAPIVMNSFQIISPNGIIRSRIMIPHGTTIYQANKLKTKPYPSPNTTASKMRNTNSEIKCVSGSNNRSDCLCLYTTLCHPFQEDHNNNPFPSGFSQTVHSVHGNSHSVSFTFLVAMLPFLYKAFAC